MVTRCVCFNITFTDMKAVAEKTGARTLEELQERMEFARNCRLCVPYVERMLATGETEFEAMDA